MIDEAELTCDAITADFRILQRRRGHRFSLDDLATAWVAARARPEARVALDLGCGIGSVLLMVGWRIPGARLFGVEAQELSAAIARRNVAENGLSARAEVTLGDLREATAAWPHPRCDLVTGTPPYLPLGTALLSPDPQRAAARIELRGGVEDYLAAAARVLAPAGRVVVCADGRFPARVTQGARVAELAPVARLDVLARAAARAPLFAVWTLAHASEGGPPLVHETLAMRDERGERTEAGRAMRRDFGLD
jgi:tRNA1(Val) A37 N6-methylase TrmN6